MQYASMVLKQFQFGLVLILSGYRVRLSKEMYIQFLPHQDNMPVYLHPLTPPLLYFNSKTGVYRGIH